MNKWSRRRCRPSRQSWKIYRHVSVLWRVSEIIGKRMPKGADLPVLSHKSDSVRLSLAPTGRAPSSIWQQQSSPSSKTWLTGTFTPPWRGMNCSGHLGGKAWCCLEQLYIQLLCNLQPRKTQELARVYFYKVEKSAKLTDIGRDQGADYLRAGARAHRCLPCVTHGGKFTSCAFLCVSYFNQGFKNLGHTSWYKVASFYMCSQFWS